MEFREGMTNPINRRKFLTAVSGSAIVLTPTIAEARLLATPRQAEGPFYPRERDLFPDIDNDLVLIASKTKQAGGIILNLTGDVVDRDGAPVAGAIVEIWQCDANGRYLHRGDRSNSRKRDAYFQGFGHARTDDNGRYKFRTIKPVPYPGRTPHIHFKVHNRSGESLTTQMYVAGDPDNDRDGLYNYLSPKERQRVTIPLEDASDGSVSGDFRIVVPWRA